MEGKPVSERQIKLRHHGCLQAANRAADALDWNREELVDHQLGSFAKAIYGAWFNNDPHQRCFDKGAGEWTQRDAGMGP